MQKKLVLISPTSQRLVELFGLEEIKHKYGTNIATRVSDVVYTDDGFDIIPGLKSIYIKGRGIEPLVQKEVIEEARKYLSKSEDERLGFLLNVYRQIVKDDEGEYAIKFMAGKERITIILNYFADKLRGIGRTQEADELEARIKEVYPQPKKKPTRGRL